MKAAGTPDPTILQLVWVVPVVDVVVGAVLFVGAERPNGWFSAGGLFVSGGRVFVLQGIVPRVVRNVF